MNRATRRHTKNLENRLRDVQAGQDFDTYMTIGMYLCEIALANRAKDRYGKRRLQQLEADVHDLCQTEILGGAEKFTDNYRNNLGHGFARIADRLEQIHGPGHCDWLRKWLDKMGWTK